MKKISTFLNTLPIPTGLFAVAPTVTLASVPHIGEQQIYLSQIPHTGLGLWSSSTTIYWMALVCLALAVAYFILFYIAPLVNRSIRDFASRISSVLNTQELAPVRTIPTTYPYMAPQKSSVMQDVVPEASNGYSSYDGFKSFARSGALSIDDIVKGLSNGPATKAVSPRAPEMKMNVEPIYENVEPIYNLIAENAHISAQPADAHGDVRGLASAIVGGDRAAVFSGLRQHVRGGGSPERFVSSILNILDDIYRSRIDGAPCDAAVSRITARLDTPTLEKLITALTTGIDSSYTDKMTGAKLALTRALAVLGA